MFSGKDTIYSPTSSVNIRSDASTSASVVKAVPAGQPLGTVSSIYTDDTTKSTWYKVDTGWVADGAYLAKMPSDGKGGTKAIPGKGNTVKTIIIIIGAALIIYAGYKYFTKRKN